MHDLKLYGKDEYQVSSLVNVVYTLSADARMVLELNHMELTVQINS